MNISKILPIDTKGIVMKTKLLVEQHLICHTKCAKRVLGQYFLRWLQIQ